MGTGPVGTCAHRSATAEQSPSSGLLWSSGSCWRPRPRRSPRHAADAALRPEAVQAWRAARIRDAVQIRAARPMPGRAQAGALPWPARTTRRCASDAWDGVPPGCWCSVRAPIACRGRLASALPPAGGRKSAVRAECRRLRVVPWALLAAAQDGGGAVNRTRAGLRHDHAARRGVAQPWWGWTFSLCGWRSRSRSRCDGSSPWPLPQSPDLAPPLALDSQRPWAAAGGAATTAPRGTVGFASVTALCCPAAPTAATGGFATTGPAGGFEAMAGVCGGVGRAERSRYWAACRGCGTICVGAG